MATTSPDNIWTPDAGDDYSLTVDLAAMANTIQDAISDVRSPRYAVYSYTKTNAGDGTVITDAALAYNGAESTTNEFVSSVAGSTINLLPGIYDISFIVRLGAGAVNRTYIEIVSVPPGGSSTMLAHVEGVVNQDSYSLSTLYRVNTATPVTFTVFKNTGTSANISGAIRILKHDR